MFSYWIKFWISLQSTLKINLTTKYTCIYFEYLIYLREYKHKSVHGEAEEYPAMNREWSEVQFNAFMREEWRKKIINKPKLLIII